MTNTQRTLNTVDHAIQLHMQLLEHHLTDMLENIHDALDELPHSKCNRAIGTLMSCESGYQQLYALYQSIVALHCNADIIERPDDS
jgi:hypothetical protein